MKPFRRLLTILALASVYAHANAQKATSGPALDAPKVIEWWEAKGERDGDGVLCVERKGDYRTYPLRILAWHRVVNDSLGGVPLLVAYDPDSAATGVYDPTANGGPLTFDAAPNRNGLPMLRDRETKSLWSLITGDAVEGKLKGRRMTRLPGIIRTWRYWRKRHPNSPILKENTTQRANNAMRTTPEKFQLPKSTLDALPDKRDQRLPDDTLVLGVIGEKEWKAYPIDLLEQGDGVVNDTLDGKAIAIFYNPATHANNVFESWSNPFGRQYNEVEARQITFKAIDAEGDRTFVDSQNFIWDIEGGSRTPGVGTSLTPVRYLRCRWYAWAAAYPKTDLRR